MLSAEVSLDISAVKAAEVLHEMKSVLFFNKHVAVFSDEF